MPNLTYLARRGEHEWELDVTYRRTYAGCSVNMGSMNYEGHPAEAAEYEIEEIKCVGCDVDEPFEPTADEYDAIYTFISENDEPDDGSDYAYESYRDERDFPA